MAEGTRFREIDARLGVHETKLTELQEAVGKTRTEVTQQFADMNLKMDQKMDGFVLRLDKMDHNFGELKQLLMGLQNNQSSGILNGNKDSTLSEETILGSNSTPEVTHNHPLTPIFIPSTLHNTVPFTLVTTPVYT